MLNREFKVFVTKLKGHAVLSRDVLNDKGQKVLAKGTELTGSQIVRLKQLGIIEVWVQGEAVPVTTEVASLEPVLATHLVTSDPWGLRAETVRLYRQSVVCVEELFKAAPLERRISIEPTERVLRDLWESCAQEKNFLNLVINLRTLDEYTFQHSIGVGMLMSWIGKWMGLTDQQCQELLLAGTLHDIGKCLVDQAILQKPGRLTLEEYEHIKQHASLGYMILNNSGVAEHIAAVARNHHERMDGSGYPRGLAGSQIDLYSRIASVADVFNAMTSRRVYRNPSSYYKVLDEVHQNAFGDLDPVIVSLFVNKMTAFLVGNVVCLNDGTVGTVVMIPVDRPTRPLLKTDAGFIDLKTRSDLFIEDVKAI